MSKPSINDRFQCDYLDYNKQPASDMLYKCVQDHSQGYDFNCQQSDYSMDYKDSNKLLENQGIKRGIDIGLGDLRGDEIGIEGFTDKIFLLDNGPGESNLQIDKCPEGYKKCSKTGKCIQVCINCKYRDDMKSKEFNEADPCFPEGVYNGITNEGYIKCTCGFNDQYCSNNFIKDMFSADGILFMDKKMENNIGDVTGIRDLFLIDQL